MMQITNRFVDKNFELDDQMMQRDRPESQKLNLLVRNYLGNFIMSKIKISYKVNDVDYRLKHHKRKPYPTCKRCGSKLVDEKSIKRGYGHKCFSKHPGIIVLEIMP